ncbi:hypothetical protein [Solidesulfovibrio alcoholivorans]|uniref:hypothetical protein n=1 Tax=Solidesulfovibrio alcoholivorans TaxID=81406 RepID=UPI0004984616|nr:hypothetical protein [Solidesulfovibrio alcoholivorans]
MPEPNLTNPELQAPPLLAVPPKTKARKLADGGAVTAKPEPANVEAAATDDSQAEPLDLSLATFAAGVHTEIPYEPDVALAAWRESVMDRADAARARDVLNARIAELTAEVTAYADEMGELLDDLKKANLPPDLACTAKNLLMLIEIDKGMTVKAVAEALQTVAYDMKSRLMDKYKGKVKVVLTCSPDPADLDSMIVLAEVSPETPAQATGGKLTLATDGTVVTRRESAQAMQLKMIETEPDPLVEMYGEAEGSALRDIMRAKGINEITMGTGVNKVKVKLVGGRAKKAA